MKKKCVVNVENIGEVYSGHDSKKAKKIFKNYVTISKNGFGRGGSESVVLFCETKAGSGEMELEDEFQP